MSDNRTTELREKLDALGIEHTDASYKRKVPITVWNSNGAIFCFVDDSNQIDLHIENPTPEQAIAVTLGEKPRDKTEEWLLKACNQATQDYVKALEELVRDMWREITTCPDYTVPPCMTDSICERVRNLGAEMGGDDDE